MKADLAKIVWPATPSLRDVETWKKNTAFVRMLTEACHVTEWLHGTPGVDGYLGMPYKFAFASAMNVMIEFLPHWGFYNVDGIALAIPTHMEEVAQAVEAVLALRRLGMRH